ncbi:MAG TPA: GNVR domain-containing protein [bacterium]
MAQGELTLSDYWRILRKRRWLIATSFCALVTVTGLYLNRQIPVYQAVAKIKLEKPRTLSGNMFAGHASYFENPIATESQVIESRLVAETVARQLHPEMEETDPRRFHARVNDIQGSVKADPIPDTNIVRIVVRRSHPEEAARVANLAAGAYIEVNLQERNKQARQVREFIESQLIRTEVRLKTAEEGMRRMREGGIATGRAVVLQNRIADLEGQLASLLPKLTEAHPDVIRLQSQIAQLREQLQAMPAAELEFARLQRDLELNDRAYRDLRQRYEEARIAEAEKVADASIIEAAGAPKSPIAPRVRLGLLVGGILGFILGCVLAFVFEAVDTSLGTIEDVETLLGAPVLAVIPHAGREGEPRTPRPLRQRLRWMNRWRWWKVWLPKQRRQREEELEIRLGLHAHYHPNSPVAEAYRILRTNLKLAPDLKVLLVTSAGPGEGKTSVLSNLGVVLAQNGVRTLLVSSDLRKPTLEDVFGIDRESGLGDVLHGTVPLERAVRGLSDFILGKFGYDEAVKNPYLANLFILPCGHERGNPAELMASQSMRDVAGALRGRYDAVLLDGTPILPVADSLLLAPYVDGVVLVYQVGRISRAALLRAKIQLESAGTRIIGVVLNHVRPEVQSHPGYYYYYRERFGKEGHEPDSSASEASAGRAG